MPELNQSKKDAFAGKMVGILNGAALALMTSIGRQTGLLEVMAALPPLTSQKIAKAAGLHERYAREWLGAMVTGGIVEFDLGKGTYILPAEHAAVITNAPSQGLRSVRASRRRNVDGHDERVPNQDVSLGEGSSFRLCSVYRRDLDRGRGEGCTNPGSNLVVLVQQAAEEVPATCLGGRRGAERR